jgi:hypothetical protein
MGVQTHGTSGGLHVVEELARRFQAGELASAFELYHPALRHRSHGTLETGHD